MLCKKCRNLPAVHLRAILPGRDIPLGQAHNQRRVAELLEIVRLLGCNGVEVGFTPIHFQEFHPNGCYGDMQQLLGITKKYFDDAKEALYPKRKYPRKSEQRAQLDAEDMRCAEVLAQEAKKLWGHTPRGRKDLVANIRCQLKLTEDMSKLLARSVW